MQASSLHKEGTDLGELTATVAAVLRHLVANTGRDFFAAVEERGLSFTQVKLLNALDELDEPHSIGSLSERIGLSPAAVSRAVDGLVQRGDVGRQEDPRDRRSKLVALTAQGRRTFRQLHALRVAGVRELLSELDPDERETLMQGLQPLARRS
ncbi:MAG TPA: MarR family transcriptional regulator [Thermoleophilaceae bacterium]|nr:MarR family transcriptional regulator [Thermoleophilaceae bacterium]